MPTNPEQLKQKGREEGLRAGISVMLKIRFPEETGSLGDQISELHSVELLTDFLDRCMSARNVDELQAYPVQRRRS